MTWCKLANESSKQDQILVKWWWSTEYGDVEEDKVWLEVPDLEESTFKQRVEKFFSNPDLTYHDAGPHCDSVCFNVYYELIPKRKPEFMFSGVYSYGECEWHDDEISFGY